MELLNKGKEKINSNTFFGLLKSYNLNSASDYFKEALSIFKKEGNVFGIHEALYNLAIVNEELLNLREAIEYYLESAKTIEHLDYEKAIQIYKSTMEFFGNKSTNYRYCANRIAILYEKYQQLNKAIEYFKLASNMEKVADILALQKEYKQAETIYDSIIAEKKEFLLGKWTINELILKSILCSFFTRKNIHTQFNYYTLQFPRWQGTEEYNFCKSLIESISNKDEKAFSMVIKDFYKLTEWFVCVLFEIKLNFFNT